MGGTMVCEHLSELESALHGTGIAETFRGQAWSKGCREWVYFDCILNLNSIREQFDLPEFVINHEHFGTHDGQESGFVCSRCQDGIMGRHPDSQSNAVEFPGRRFDDD